MYAGLLSDYALSLVCVVGVLKKAHVFLYSVKKFELSIKC